MRVAAAVAQIAQRGAAAVMVASEVVAGHEIVAINSVPWFMGLWWDRASLVSIDRKRGEVWLVAIIARRPGEGALRRMVRGIQHAGLTPVIAAPMGVTMPAILAHWGWQRRVDGEGWTAVETWRPPAPAI